MDQFEAWRADLTDAELAAYVTLLRRGHVAECHYALRGAHPDSGYRGVVRVFDDDVDLGGYLDDLTVPFKAQPTKKPKAKSKAKSKAKKGD